MAAARSEGEGRGQEIYGGPRVVVGDDISRAVGKLLLLFFFFFL
jgi:hypothetical protein